jgi:hypothetical protein
VYFSDRKIVRLYTAALAAAEERKLYKFKIENIIGNQVRGMARKNKPVTGKPPNPHWDFNSLASATVVVGDKTTGSEMKPFSYRFTFLTISAWSSAVQL